MDFVIVTSDGTVRRPTPLECESAQGFPDNWTVVVVGGRRALDIVRYRGVGNSMSVPVMEYIGYHRRRRIRAAG
ncbi:MULTISPECIES: DNA cytosine methyltransferase [unclassified Ensifer]|uniref:DNA cytosine methyltransferase n=1 Tax=unclassified Ensifer TaxID=2633371 RepID=UPI001146A9FB|nr:MULTISPECIES: DNA cytosine methyltransferase [unclassified Ensifer]